MADITVRDGDNIFRVYAAERGPAGVGMPAGGTTGQVATKASNADYDIEWEDQVGQVESVNGQTGVVVLDAEDVGALESVVAGSNVSVDDTDPLNPIISATGSVQSVNGKTGAVVLDKDDVGLDQVNNTSDLDKPISDDTEAALDLKQDLADKNQSGGYAGLDGSGKINPSQLPSITIGNVYVVDSQAEMTALAAVVGDVAIRTDQNKTYILSALPASTVENWEELLTPVDQVQSVFGRQGTISAQSGDYTGTQITNTPSGSIASTTVQGAINELESEKQPIDGDLTTISALTPSNDDILQRKSGAWTNRTPAQVKTDLALTKSDVGLSNVDNTADLNKPISTATQTAITTVSDQTIPEVGSMKMREPAMAQLYDDLLNDVQTNPVPIVFLGDSITVIGEYPEYVGAQLATRYNVNSNSSYSVIDTVGFRHAYPGGAFGSMNGTIQGANVRGAHIGPGDLGVYDPTVFGAVIPATAGNYLSTPDAAVLDITGDISGFYDTNYTDWTPPSSVRTLMSKWGSAGQRSWLFEIVNSTGALRLTTSVDGTASTVVATSTVGTGFTDGTRGYVGFTMDVDNGSGNSEIKFWKSSDNITWTQLGSTRTGAVTTIFNSTAPLELGSKTGGAVGQLDHKVMRATVWSGLRNFVAGTGGTAVFDANMAALSTLGQTSFTESANGATVTVNASAGTVAFLRTLATNGTLLSSGQSADCTYTCSGMYIIFGGGGGTLTVKDGGSGGTTKATIDTSLYSGDNNLYWIDLTTYASHNVWIGCTGSDTILDGICTTVGNQARGTLVWRIGQPGITTQSFNYYPGHGLNLVARLKTLYSGRDPHVFIVTGYNDATSTYATKLGQMINDVQARTNGSIGVWSPWGRSGEDSQARSKILRTLQATENIAVIDSGKVLGGVGAYADYSDLTGDNVHPNNNGTLALAMQFTAVMTGDPVGANMSILWDKAYPYTDYFGYSFTTSGGASLGTNLTVPGTAAITGETTAAAFTTTNGLTLNAVGKVVIGQFFGSCYEQFYVAAADTQAELGMVGSSIANLVFGVSAPGIAVGVGGSTAQDTVSMRRAAHTWGQNMGGAALTNWVAHTGIAYTNVTQVGNVGGGTDDLMSWSMPASTLATNKESISIEAWGSIANNANAKTLTFNFGSTTVVSATLPTSVAAGWRLTATVVRTGATTQLAQGTITVGNGATYPINSTPTTPAETLSGAVTVKCTAAATADNDIVQRFMRVTFNGTN